MAEQVLPPLGALVMWYVKGFPASLRDQINQAAAGKGVTVAQFLVAHFEKHGVDGIEVNAVKLDPVNQAPGTFRELSELARTLTPPERDSEAMRLARSMVRDQLQDLRDTLPKRLIPKRLAG